MIGVLALQGDFEKHLSALKEMKVEGCEVREVESLVIDELGLEPSVCEKELPGQLGQALAVFGHEESPVLKSPTKG